MFSLYTSRSASQAVDHYSLLEKSISTNISKSKIAQTKKKEIQKDLVEIITAQPKVLLALNKKYTSGPFKISDKRLKTIFKYSSFRSSHGMKLVKSLGIECCPYCNKNYISYLAIHKVGNKGISNIFPEFDHFYPQKYYPLLGVSFFNLIPSCSFCNTHLKHSKDPVKHNLFHPYTELKNGGFKFRFFANNYLALIGKSTNVKWSFRFTEVDKTVNDTIKNSLDFFAIKETYEKCHSDLIKEIIDKRITYAPKYLEMIKKTYNLDFDDAYRILFESDYCDGKLLQRPFGKLKKDIYNDLEIANSIRK